MLKFPQAMLWIPTAFNLYLVGSIACWYVPTCRGANPAQGDLGLMVLTLWISLPIAIVLLVVLLTWGAIRYATAKDREIHIPWAPILVATLNIFAPAALLYAL